MPQSSETVSRLCAALVCLILVATLLCPCYDISEDSSPEMTFVENGQPVCVREVGQKWARGDGYLASTGKNYLYAGRGLGAGDFQVRARLSLDRLAGTAAAFVVDGNQFGFEGAHGKMFVKGPRFGRSHGFGKSRIVANPKDYITPGKPFDLDVIRKGRTLTFRIDGRQVWSTQYAPSAIGEFGLRPWRATMRVYEFSAKGRLIEAAIPKEPARISHGISSREAADCVRSRSSCSATSGSVLDSTLSTACKGRP